MLPYRKICLAVDRPQKNTPAVLVGGMCGWHVRSNTQQRQMLGFVLFIMPCIARDTSRLELPVFLCSLDFLLLFDHAKSKKAMYLYKFYWLCCLIKVHQDKHSTNLILSDF
jgi:hypothetical protein